MSQLASSRPALRSAMPRPLRTRPEPRPLRVVSRPPGDGRIGFVMFCLTLLIGGLMGLLMLNTSMATSAFELRELRVTSDELGGDVVRIDLDRPMDEIRSQLSQHPVKTRLSLTGTVVVARDIAHAKIAELLDAGGEMPAYLRDHPVYYAGPAKTPEGYASGSFGPTTAGRMDSYVEKFQAAGGSLVMLAKGNRSQQVTDACRAHGGFYLGSIGGPAARLAQDCIRKVEVLEYPELGMEAVWRIEVEDFPAFIVVDDKGNDFFAQITTPVALGAKG